MSDLTKLISPPAESALERMFSWERMAKNAYAPNTIRALKADAKVFVGFCLAQGLEFLPAAPETVRAFVLDCVALGKKPATVRRHVSTIATVHVAAGYGSPCASEPVRLALKEMGRTTISRQDQAAPLGIAVIEEFIKTAGDSPQAIRAAAILTVAYDTMARRSELVAFDFKDIQYNPDGSATITIRRSKADQEGRGATAYLSRKTMEMLERWLELAKIKEGPLFRRIIGRGSFGARLDAGAIARLYKRVGQFLDLPASVVGRLSGHSTRIGAAQDLLSLNIELPALMQAGRWKSAAMPLRYGERILASKGGMAQAAQLQGRS